MLVTKVAGLHNVVSLAGIDIVCGKATLGAVSQQRLKDHSITLEDTVLGTTGLPLQVLH